MFGNFFNNIGMVIPIIVAVPFFIIALVFVYLALRGRGQANRAIRDWQTTNGRVLFSDIQARRSRSGSGHTTSYYPVVVYEYQVGGHGYQGQRLSFGNEIGWGGFTGVAQKKVDQYPPGSVVPVYYNPENPNEAVLEVSAPSGCVYWVIAIIMIVIVAASLFFSLGMNNFVNGITSFTSSVSK